MVISVRCMRNRRKALRPKRPSAASFGNGLQTNHQLLVKTTSVLGSWFGLKLTGSWFNWFKAPTDYQNY